MPEIVEANYRDVGRAHRALHALGECPDIFDREQAIIAPDARGKDVLFERCDRLFGQGNGTA